MPKVYSPKHYEKHDPTFVDDLKASHKHSLKVAEWLRRRGFRDVEVFALRIRPSAAKMRGYGDQGDIAADGLRMEAKRRTIDFTSPDDFPYDTIIVDTVSSWDKAKIKPELYVLTNKDLTYCCVVMGATRRAWKQTTRYDRKKKRHRRFYECPISYTEFFRFNWRSGSSASATRRSSARAESRAAAAAASGRRASSRSARSAAASSRRRP
jgi:hypothetical protein